MHNLRQHGDEQLEARRWQAQQAARPELTPRERAESLYHAMCVARFAGDIDKARALATELKPLVQYLPE